MLILTWGRMQEHASCSSVSSHKAPPTILPHNSKVTFLRQKSSHSTALYRIRFKLRIESTFLEKMYKALRAAHVHLLLQTFLEPLLCTPPWAAPVFVQLLEQATLSPTSEPLHLLCPPPGKLPTFHMTRAFSSARSQSNSISLEKPFPTTM